MANNVLASQRHLWDALIKAAAHNSAIPAKQAVQKPCGHSANKAHPTFLRNSLCKNSENPESPEKLPIGTANIRHSRAGGNPAYKARASRSFRAERGRGRQP